MRGIQRFVGPLLAAAVLLTSPASALAANRDAARLQASCNRQFLLVNYQARTGQAIRSWSLTISGPRGGISAGHFYPQGGPRVLRSHERLSRATWSSGAYVISLIVETPSQTLERSLSLSCP